MVIRPNDFLTGLVAKDWPRARRWLDGRFQDA